MIEKINSGNKGAILATLLKVAEESNIGIVALANVPVGAELKIFAIETRREGRADITPATPVFHFRSSDGKRYQATANAMPALRVCLKVDEAAVSTAIANIAYSHQIAGVAKVTTMKDLLEQLDDSSKLDLETAVFKVVGHKVQTTMQGGNVPAQQPRNYNGSQAYYDANAAGQGLNARVALYESGLKSGCENYTASANPEQFAWTPIIAVG